MKGVYKHDPKVIIFVLNDGNETEQLRQFLNGQTTVFGNADGLQMAKRHVHIEELAIETSYKKFS